MASGIKILLIRFSSIGDIVLTSSVIRCINNQSDFEIHALTKIQNKDLFSNNPRISKVYSFKDSTNEVIQHITDNFPRLTYNTDKCKRDTGYC